MSIKNEINGQNEKDELEIKPETGADTKIEAGGKKEVSAGGEQDCCGGHEHKDGYHEDCCGGKHDDCCEHDHEDDDHCCCGAGNHEHETGGHDDCCCGHEHKDGDHEDCCGGKHDDCCGHEHDTAAHHSHGPQISCGCGHCHEDGDEDEEMTLKKILAALALFAGGLLVEHLPFFENLLGSLNPFGELPVHRALYLAFYAVSFLLCGKDVIKSALQNIFKGEIFDEKFLMSVASLGAIFVGEIGEAVAVMLFYNIGEFFQDYAVDKSRDSISALMDIRPDKAFVLRNGKTVEVSPEEVKIDEIIEVKPGERVPLDGIIAEGSSFMDTSALTGESVPRKVEAGNEILAGFVNQNGVVRIKVTKTYGDSAVTRILELTQEAGEVKAKSEKFITRFSKVYTPVVCFSALAVGIIPPLVLQFFAPELFASYGWSVWIYRALTFLVVSCPCALVISVPLSFFSGIGAASKHGILIKGSNFIEALSKVDTAVFDKTGTLTKGTFAVSKVICAGDLSEDELVALAAHGEHFSNHPISKSIKADHLNRAGGEAGKALCCETVLREDAEEISGHGVKIKVDGKEILLGAEKLLRREGIEFTVPQNENLSGTVIHVARDGKYEGLIVISDELKEDSQQAIKALKKAGVSKTVMLTGDTEKVAAAVASQLGLDEFYADLLPQDKVSRVEELLKVKKGSLLFAGDGVNDSPVLARADVGVAMGALGSDAAIEAADVVIMDDKPSRLVDAIRVSRSTMAVVNQNIIVSIGVKVGIMVFSALGISNMWVAVFGDVGVCFLAILNSMRVLKK